MIYHSSKHKALIVPADEMAAPMTVFPKHRFVKINGTKHIAVPDTLENSSKLAKYHKFVPNRMRCDYHWRSKYPAPMKHQVLTAEFIVNHKRCFVFNDIGTAKTLSALWAADYLMSIGKVKKVLISSTLSTLWEVWEKHIFENFPHRSCTILHGSKDRRLRELKKDFDFYIINHDGPVVLGTIKENVSGSTYIASTVFDDMDDFDMVIVDEGAVLRNSKTNIYQAHDKIAGSKSFRRIVWMTGSPMPNAPTDAWAQGRLVNPTTVDKYFSWFREKTMFQKGPFKWVARKGWEDYVYKTLQPSVRFVRDECLDLPPCVVETRSVEMSAKQKEAYKSMMNNLHVEFEDGRVTALNEGVKVSKLLQIACGVVYDSEGRTQVIGCPQKEKELIHLIESAGNKALVFTPFTHSIKHLEKVISKHFSVRTVHGETSKGKRNEAFRMFQNEDLQVILAHQQTMAHGLDLWKSHTIIWWCPPQSYEHYEQANGRITRPGQIFKQTIIHLVCSDIERRVYSRLGSKQKMQGLILEMLK